MCSSPIALLTMLLIVVFDILCYSKYFLLDVKINYFILSSNKNIIFPVSINVVSANINDEAVFFCFFTADVD